MKLAIALLLSLSSSVGAAALHVASDGTDANDGSAARPFATLERARDELRKRDSKTVVLHGGTYVRNATFELSAADSGTTWQADGEVRIVGGPTLPAVAFSPVSDEKIVARLRKGARGNVVQTRLADMPLGEYPDTFRGVPAAPELFFNDQRMTVARWPNEGWATIAKIVESGSVPRYGDQSNRPGVFEYDGDAPSRWDDHAGVWLQGYWCYDWYDQTIRIGSIDREKKRITLAAPAMYGINQGNPSPRRFRAINVLEELDSPGEFYIDRAARVLYFYPPSPIAEARIAISTLDGPLFRMTDAEHVTIRGITFEASLGNGVEITNGRNNSIERCTVRNVRQIGIVVKGGAEHHVRDCDIYDTGTGGLVLEGGDRKTLTPARHEAINNRILDFSRHQQTAAYGIAFGGVGNRAANNLIERAPHQAVYIGGNDHVFELNIVRNVVTETDDAGAVYKGRNPSCRGNVIRHNFFVDIGSPMGHGTGAVYFDDGDGGDLVFGNVFLRCGHPGGGSFGTIFSHGGHDIRAENNIFIDCKRPLGSAPWNDQLWKATIDGGNDCQFQEKLLHEVDITKPPYTTRYPELVGFMTPQPGAPRENHAKKNVFVRPAMEASGNWKSAASETFVTNDDSGFVDAAKDNYQLRPDAEVFKRLPGFQPIPFDRIGPRRSVVVGEAAPPLERFAGEELDRYIARLSPDGVKPTFLVGSPATNANVRRALGETDWPKVSDQGIVLKRASLDGRPVFVVGGGSPRATLWAVYDLVERWGVRYLLHGDVFPDGPVELRFPEQDVVLEPNLRVRQWRVLNEHAMGPISWGIADYRTLLNQLAKLKFNRVLLYIWPGQPFLPLEYKGIRQTSGTLFFGHRYPITNDMIGRSLFGPDEKEFWNPDLPLPGDPDALTRAGVAHVRSIMDLAHARGMECEMPANLLEFPREFKPLLAHTKPVDMVGTPTIGPGPDADVDDPELAGLARAVLDTTLTTYPDLDYIALDMPEWREWVGQYERAWKALDVKYGVGKTRSLDELLAAAASRKDYAGGADRAVKEVKADVVALYFYDRFMSAPLHGESHARFVMSTVAEELFPVLARVLPPGSETLNFVDYTPSRIVKRREALKGIPAREIPSTLIYTLHDDNVGVLPQLATGSLHELTKDLRDQGWAGFSTRYWLIGDHDPCVAYLSQAAWDGSATPQAVYRDQIAHTCGDAAIADMLTVFREVEAATVILEWHGLGLTFTVPEMMMQHWKPAAMSAELQSVIPHYQAALDAARRAYAASTPAGRKSVDYWIGRLEFGIAYMRAIEAVRAAATAEEGHDRASAAREAQRAVELVKQALTSYARVANDRSDRGAIAVMNEYVYRPLQAKASRLP